MNSFTKTFCLSFLIAVLIPLVANAEKAKKEIKLLPIVFYDAPFQFDHYSSWSKELYREKAAAEIAPSTFLDVHGAIHMDINDGLPGDYKHIYAVFGTSNVSSLDEVESVFEENYSSEFYKFTLLNSIQISTHQGYDFLELEFKHTTANGTNVDLLERQLHVFEGDLYIVFRIVGPVEDMERFIDYNTDHIKESFVVKDEWKAEDSVPQHATTEVMPPNTVGPVFSDVSFDNSHIEAIAWAKGAGIFSGYADGSFKPDAHINRAELVKILVESNSSIPVNAVTNSRNFVDVPTDSWFAPYVYGALEAGAIQGYEDNTFRPANTVNMAEALKMIYESFKIPTPNTGGSWYEKYVQHANMHSIVFSDVSEPSKSVDRKTIAWILWKLHENYKSNL